MARIFTITIEGNTEADVESAAEEVKRLISEGYTSGMNRNDDGSFHFDSTGDYDEEQP